MKKTSIVICIILVSNCFFIGLARQTPRLKNFSGESDLNGNYKITKTETVKNFKIIEYEGEWDWYLYSLWTPIPIGIWIPISRKKYIIESENRIMAKYGTTKEGYLLGVSCNYIFPIVGIGCIIRSDRSYFDFDPKLNLINNLNTECNSKDFQNLEIEFGQIGVSLNKRKANDNFEDIFLSLNIPKDKHKQFEYFYLRGIYISPEIISINLSPSFNTNGLCIFTGKFRLFGHEIGKNSKTEKIIEILKTIPQLKNLKEEEYSDTKIWGYGKYQIYLYSSYGYLTTLINEGDSDQSIYK